MTVPHPTWTTLHERVMQIPDIFAQVNREQMPKWDLTQLRGKRIVTTGAGLAEGPARLLALIWQDLLGLAASFVPLSCFTLEGAAPRADVLILFSQGFSPNATLALTHLPEVSRALVITSCPDGDPSLCHWLASRSGESWKIVPPKEEGFLLRVQGPIAAIYAAFCMTWDLMPPGSQKEEWRQLLDEMPTTYARCLAHDVPHEPWSQSDHLVMVTAGDAFDLTHSVRWKVLEGMWHPLVPVVDILQFSHGPLQAYSTHQDVTWLVCRSNGDKVLYQRFCDTVPSHHKCVQLKTSMPRPWHLFELDALLNRMILEQLKPLGRDLSKWPAQYQDEALYQFSGADVE